MRSFPPSLTLSLLALLGTAAGAGTPAATSGAPQAVAETVAVPTASPAAGELSGAQVVLETVEGDITLKLFPEDAPGTVANFVKLVREGFYDGLTFHRVVPGFVIQGGDPNSRDENPFNDGQGGPGYTVPAEFKRKHVRGAVATARMPDVVNPKRESNGSQFYIALRDLPSLDNGYTVFAQVVSGWETIDRIVALADLKDIARQNDNANPGKLALIQHARLVPRAKQAARGAGKEAPKPAAVTTAPAAPAPVPPAPADSTQR